MALKDWKKFGTNGWENQKNKDLVQTALNPNRPKNGKNSYQTFLFYKERRVPKLLSQDKLVSKKQAIAYAKAYMRKH